MMKKANWMYLVLGIGIGLLIAAGLFLTFGGGEKEKLTDREVIDRAKDLGMIFITESGKEREDKAEAENKSEEKPDKKDKKDKPEAEESKPKDESKTESAEEDTLQVITEEEENPFPEGSDIEKKSYF